MVDPKTWTVSHFVINVNKEIAEDLNFKKSMFGAELVNIPISFVKNVRRRGAAQCQPGSPEGCRLGTQGKINLNGRDGPVIFPFYNFQRSFFIKANRGQGLCTIDTKCLTRTRCSPLLGG